ncbi:MAG: protein phosphatase 2C family protein [Parachlamydiaceae bacterium]|nr:protein phosphatase 2C family protein [Parachlamydiaceae bacterium]
MKARNEHAEGFKLRNPLSLYNPYEYPEQLQLKAKDPIHLEWVTACVESQGYRETMEDAYFDKTLPGGRLLGVLDGHGGSEVADYVSARFQILFPQMLEKHKTHRLFSKEKYNIHQALEETCFVIQNEIIEKSEFNHMGCTAVICYIEQSTNCIYTATLGDSEANIYRNIEGKYWSIPISCIRDWGSWPDELRAAIATRGEYKKPIVDYWEKEGITSRHRRIHQKLGGAPSENFNVGCNVSRAFGDQINNIGRLFNTVVTKPKLDRCYLLPGDIIVLACDGLRECIEEDVIVNCVKASADKLASQISHNLVDLAIRSGSNDNVTVLTVKIK